ncbi:MAG: TatD family hydrolase [Proteobacteria bacterium]|nr:TatD family hydrolase [Pseudomonadota bacterium]
MTNHPTSALVPPWRGLVDAHAHPTSYPDPHAYLRQQWHMGLEAVFAAGTSPQDWPHIDALCQVYPMRVWGCLGIHPYWAALAPRAQAQEALDRLASRLAQKSPGICAIGECGLDARYPNLPQQQWVFRAQIDMAMQRKLPLVVHCVKTWHDMQSYLKQHSGYAIFHAFNAGPQIQQWILDQGHFISLGRSLLRTSAPLINPALASRCLIESDNDAGHDEPPMNRLFDLSPLTSTGQLAQNIAKAYKIHMPGAFS